MSITVCFKLVRSPGYCWVKWKVLNPPFRLCMTRVMQLYYKTKVAIKEKPEKNIHGLKQVN